MDKIEKIIQVIKHSRQPIRYRDLCLLLNHFGYILVRQRGSHAHFYKAQCPPIRFPVHQNDVKRVYARSILDILGL